MLSHTNHLWTVAFPLLVKCSTLIGPLSRSHSPIAPSSLAHCLSFTGPLPIFLFQWCTVSPINTFIGLYWSIVPSPYPHWSIALPSIGSLTYFQWSTDVLLLVLFLHWPVVLPSLVDFWSTQLSLRLQRPTV